MACKASKTQTSSLASVRLGILCLMSALVGCSSAPVGKPAASTVLSTPAGVATSATTGVAGAMSPQESRVKEMLLAGQGMEAMAQLQALAATQPQSLFVQLNLAIAYDKADRVDDAIAQYQSVLARWPGQPDAANNLALHYQTQGKLTEARELLESGLRTHNGDGSLHYNLAVLNELYFLDFSSAISHYKSYQASLAEPDKQVDAWIKDLERRAGR